MQEKRKTADEVKEIDLKDNKVEQQRKQLFINKVLEAKKMRDQMLSEAIQRREMQERLHKSIE